MAVAHRFYAHNARAATSTVASAAASACINGIRGIDAAGTVWADDNDACDCLEVFSVAAAAGHRMARVSVGNESICIACGTAVMCAANEQPRDRNEGRRAFYQRSICSH